MLSTFGSKLAVLTLASMALAPAMAFAQASNDLPPDREEIIVTHSRLGPLSEWAQMQQHSAEYRRLKEKFEPTTGSSHTDSWANDRSLAAHSNASDSFEQESASEPTPPAVQAVKDAVIPP